MNISATLGYKGQALQVHAGSAKAANGECKIHVSREYKYCVSTFHIHF